MDAAVTILPVTWQGHKLLVAGSGTLSELTATTVATTAACLIGIAFVLHTDLGLNGMEEIEERSTHTGYAAES